MSAGRIPIIATATRTEAIRRLRYSMDFTQLYNRLLQNHPFAKRYFSKANISQHINAQRVKEGLWELFKDFPDHLLEVIHDVDQLQRTSPKELLAEASKYIGEFLEGNGFNGEKSAMTAPSNPREETEFLKNPAAFFVKKYLSANNETKNDLLQLFTNIVSGITVYKDYPTMKSRLGEYFRKFYVILLAGELVANQPLPAAINPPVGRAEVSPVKAASEEFSKDYVDPDLFADIVQPLWSVAVRAKARNFIRTLGRLNSKQMPEPVRLAIEQGIRDYMEVRDRQELQDHYKTLIDSIKTAEQDFKEDNIFVSEQAYAQTADRVLSIIDSGTIPSNEELAILSKRMALTLILIAGKNS